MTKTLYILGAGGHGKVVADAAKKMSQWKQIYFLDDKLYGEEVLDINVKDKISAAVEYNETDVEFVIAIGNNSIREQLQNTLIEHKCSMATIIHPFTSISEDVIIGRGTVIFAGVVINPSTLIGEGCILNTSCSVDHDGSIGNYVHLSPGARLAGEVSIGNRTWIATNATVINSVHITKDSVIGANSLVLEEISIEGVYVGNPIRRIR